MLLDERHERAITSLMIGEGPTVAAKKAGVNRSVIYEWYKKPEFMKELNIRKSEIITKTDAYMLSNVTSNIDAMQKIARESKDTRTQCNALIWLLEKSLGKSTVKIAIDNEGDKDNVSADLIAKEIEEFNSEE